MSWLQLWVLEFNLMGDLWVMVTIYWREVLPEGWGSWTLSLPISISHLLRVVFEACWLPSTFSLPCVGVEPTCKVSVDLQPFAGGRFGRSNECPGNMDEAPMMTATENKTKIWRQRYLQEISSHVHLSHNLVIDIIKFALENRQKGNSGSKLR